MSGRFQTPIATRVAGPELEALWDEVTALPEEERRAFLDARVADPRLRSQLSELLADAERAEVFFAGLAAVVREAALSLGGHPGSVVSSAGDAPEVPPPDPLIGQLIGHYRIEATLGVGGMGVVYRALDTRLERTVALKFLPPHLSGDPEARQRFLAEARAAAALDHPNICNIHEIGGEERSFIAMAFYPGETLKRILGRGPLPIDVALDYAMQIARGLAAAHRHGIVHRDIKPANVIVTTDGVVKLLDFGIASTSVASGAEGGVIPGTIAYMSPEQITSQPVDHRTDLWSLGVLLYEMCAGVRPFVAESSVGTLNAVLHERPGLPPAVRDAMSPRAGAILDRLLEKDPAGRYGSADELIGALLDLRLTGVAASTELRPARAKRWKGAFGYGFAALAVAAFALPALRERFFPVPPLLARETTTNSAARDLFDQANVPLRFRNDSVARVSLDLFRRAVEVDSSFAGGHAALAIMYLRTAPLQNPAMSLAERTDSALRYARKAVELEGSLASAHRALGGARLGEHDFQGAEESLTQSLELDPSDGFTYQLMVHLRIFQRRFEDALSLALLGHERVPASSDVILELARAYRVNGRCDASHAWLDSLESVEPPLLAVPGLRAECFAQEGRWEEAVEVLRGRRDGASTRGGVFGFMLARAARAGATDGLDPSTLALWESEARAILDALLAGAERGTVPAMDVATVYVGLGELDHAFDWLERATQDGSLRFGIMEPQYKELHQHPRFQTLLDRLGLPRG